MKYILPYLVLAVFFTCSLHVDAQIFGSPPKLAKKRAASNQGSAPKLSRQNTDWKKNRLEYSLGLGASNLLGELGGQDKPGSKFITDIEFGETRYVVSAGVRYFLMPRQSIKTSLFYGRVRGNDALTNYPNRKYRNLHFRSAILELSAQYEYHFLKPKTKHLAAARTTAIFDGNRFGAYAFGGFGGFYFNPKAMYDGSWVALQPLGTEGQELEGGPGKKYSRINIALPLGVGFTYLANNSIQIGLEYGLRLTSTDYIDDVSGFYYDNDVLRAESGDVAADLADPNINPNPENSSWYADGGIRGNPKSRDSYMFLQFTVSSKLSKIYRIKKVKSRQGRKAVYIRNPKAKKVKKGRKMGRRKGGKSRGRKRSSPY